MLAFRHKNPEYTINGKLADRKSIESENGIKSAFRKAKEQGCSIVVLDFDMHLSEKTLKTQKIVSGLYGRNEDFTSRKFDECYLVHKNMAIVVKSDVFISKDKDTTKQLIANLLEKPRT